MAVTIPENKTSPLLKARDAVWNPTPGSLRFLALLGVVVNAGIVLTGGAVRLTKSGLGCPTWPKCTGESLLPNSSPEHSPLNMAIEFGNRTLTFLVLAVGIAVYVAARRLSPNRPELTRLALWQPVGVVVQAGVGGLTVLTKLHPTMVSPHYLLSIALIFVAFLLYVRAGEGDGPVRRLVEPLVHRLTLALVWVVVAVLAVGTFVTGSGPHAGDAEATRLPFPITDITRIHSLLAWATVGLTVALLVLHRRTGAPAGVRRAGLLLLGAILLQGVIGYVQYFLGVPELLVGAHVLGSTLLWIAALNLLYSGRTRPAPAAPAGTPAPAAARRP
ncbi:COX15/CtaA family protein [Actinocorallia sp. B10E7]|uniref:COX15/CtaA family protein n=1 Tax=Actinocorallia sp. B10E7 TaxID=3153558 RepID=UPI00325F8561